LTAKFINECGLYDLIFKSRLPAVKEFKRWVTKEVLPSIRKSGSYALPVPRPQVDAWTQQRVDSSCVNRLQSYVVSTFLVESPTSKFSKRLFAVCHDCATRMATGLATKEFKQKYELKYE